MRMTTEEKLSVGLPVCLLTLPIAFFVCGTQGAGPFVDASEARRVLNSSGYSKVNITGYRPLSCGQDDLSSTGFEATNATGQRVTGVVCCGILKGCTVRF